MQMMKKTDGNNKLIINCRGKVMRLADRTHIMGILNITPDSFSDGGLYYTKDTAIQRALQMEREGADIVDIGGESTRPGASPVPVDEEIQRVVPVIKSLADKLKVPISVDTRKAIVAKLAVLAGASMVNDISGLCYDPEMPACIAKLNVPVVIMHSRDDPAIMQSHVDYDDIISDIYMHLDKCIKKALEAGINRDHIIIDPGIGFGKTTEHNFLILKHLNRLIEMGYPLLIGVSRKSFIGKTLELPETDRLMGTAAAVAVSVFNGAHIVRVHDVKAMKQVTTIADHIRG